MKLSEFKKSLKTMEGVKFYDAFEKPIPPHFHITEVGMTTKHYIDCGGTIRDEKLVSFQLWHSYDYHHRIQTPKLEKIIAIAETQLGLEDAEIEIEYQGDTIGRYALEVIADGFQLKNKQTDCLATDACGITSKPKVSLAKLTSQTAGCTPGGGCC